MSIGVKIKSGLLADNAPHLEPDGSKLTSGERAGLLALRASVARPGRLTPGRDAVVAQERPGPALRRPGPGHRAAGRTDRHVVANDPDIAIPVAFTPPRIPVAEAGLLIDGQVDTRETAATIIDLAVRGALKVQSSGSDDFQVILLDPNGPLRHTRWCC